MHKQSDSDNDEEPQQFVPVREVVIDGLAVLKIVKHCNDNLPTMVAGSLLGLDVDGVLEVSYTYPFPARKSDGEGGDANEDIDSTEYQLAMMKMLETVNVDNNCVGWYQSMYLGTLCTNDVVGYQYSYQSSEALSDNTIVIMYDPIQSRKGKLVIKAFRLSDKYVELKKSKQNTFIKPSDILQELPLRIKNSGHVAAFLRCVQDSCKEQLDCDFDYLSMSSGDNYSERHLELLNSWLDDFVQEQQRFVQYSKVAVKPRQDHVKWLAKRMKENTERREAGEPLLSTRIEDSGLKPLPDVPPRMESLLMLGQLERYCDQVNEHVDSSLHKLIVTSQISSS